MGFQSGAIIYAGQIKIASHWIEYLALSAVMNRWHFEHAGKQHGPVGEEEIRSLLESGQIQADTLVWTDGMADWKAAGTIEGFQIKTVSPEIFPSVVSPYAPPAAAPEAGIDWSGYTPSGPQVRPWVRYLARTLDYFLFCVILGGIVAFIPAFAKMNDNVAGLLLLFLYNFFEPVMLSVIGTTPFKALLGVRVRNQDGSKLSYLRGLKRMFMVWMRGVGLGIPLVGLFTCINSYKTLNRNGITSWDADGNFLVTHQSPVWWRWLLLGVITAGFFGLMILGMQQG
jgi:hypothetical protein